LRTKLHPPRGNNDIKEKDSDNPVIGRHIPSEREKGNHKDVFSGLTSLLAGKVHVKPRTAGRVQLDLAANPIAFIESPDFLDGPALHYPQYAVARDFFELLCPFCNDLDRIREFEDVDRKDQILFEYGSCPKCGFNKYQNPKIFNHFNELIGVVGMRGGKSVLIACMSAAILHELLCVEDLQERLGLVKSQMIDGAFVASSGEQATETIYGHFRGFYDNAPWFQGYRKKLLDLEVIDPDLRRGHLYSETDRAIFFKEKRIKIQSMTSNSGSIAGHTRIFAVIDELSRMDSGESKRSATEVYRVLKHSLLTIKTSVEKLRNQGIYDVPDARMFCISSPLFEDDKAMQLLKQSDKSDKIFAFHRTTWEFNPSITKEDLADEFALDPIGAERDYGANPPGAESPFIHNGALVEVCIDREATNILTVREDFFEEAIDSFIFKYIRPKLLDIRYKNLFDYAIHCDPGQRGDSFCVAIGHKEEEILVIDGAVECRPVPKNNRQGAQPRDVYFPAMSDLIIDISKKLSLRYVSYDRWNSTEQIQRLRQSKILAFQKNLTRDDHVKFLNSIVSKSIKFPARENEYIDPAVARDMPCAKALWELKKLNDDGVKVDHPPNGSNDMIQCYVGVHRLLSNPDAVISIQEIQRNNRASSNRMGNRKLGSVIRLPPKGMRR